MQPSYLKNSTDRKVTCKIAIGSDHRGFSIKEDLKTVLEKAGHTVEDMGTFSTESADYPEFARKVASSVSQNKCTRGVLICGSGIGMSIAANKFPGVRAALCYNAEAAKMSRLHNNSNILVLGESAGAQTAREALNVWLETPFEGGRHQKRLDIIREIEKENFKKI